MAIDDPGGSTRRRLNPLGNARLTAMVGILLLAPVGLELGTILLGVHTFMSLHVFVGLALIPPVLLKLGATGWRFTRYYTRRHAYVEEGAPQIVMRLLAPLLVAATVVLFASGVAMGIVHGHTLVVARRLHGPASVVWLLLFAVHALVYLKRAWIASDHEIVPGGRPVRGRRWRTCLIAATVASGLLVGAATVPTQHHWVDLPRDHHHGDHNASAHAARYERLGRRAAPGLRVGYLNSGGEKEATSASATPIAGIASRTITTSVSADG